MHSEQRRRCITPVKLWNEDYLEAAAARFTNHPTRREVSPPLTSLAFLAALLSVA